MESVDLISQFCQPNGYNSMLILKFWLEGYSFYHMPMLHGKHFCLDIMKSLCDSEFIHGIKKK